MLHQNLLGTWKSDRIRTVRRWRWKKSTSPNQKRRFAALFGKLEVTYTKTHMITDLDGFITKSKYSIIAEGERSVVLRLEDSYSPLMKLHHIFFDSSGYWIPMGEGSQQEWFLKIPPSK